MMDRYKAYFHLRSGLIEVREYLWEIKHFPVSEFNAHMGRIAEEGNMTYLYFEEIEEVQS